MRTVSVKSAARILDVLELMAGLSQGIRVNELARQLAMPKSSASSLVATLEGRGYIRAATDGYRLADTHRRSGWVGGLTAALVRASRPAMEELVAKTGESAFLGVPTPTLEIRYVAKVVSENPLRYDGELAALRPAYCTSIGQVILASLSSTALDRYFETHELLAVTPRTVTDPKLIRKVLAQARARGYVTIADSHVLGASGVAAPIVAEERVVGGLALIAPSARFDPARKRSISAVVEAAQQINASLASRESPRDPRNGASAR